MTRAARGGLTDPQRRFLEEFFHLDDMAETFCLAGGTALAAFHLGHRLSEDLDLFVVDPAADVDLPRDVLPIVREIAAGFGWDAQERALGARHARLEIRVPGGEPHHLRRIDLARPAVAFVEPPPVREGGIRVAGLRDLAAGKLAAASRRRELKDVVDLYAIESSPLGDLRVALTLADRPGTGFAPLELAARAIAVEQERDQWESFCRDYLHWDISFHELVAFGRRLARLIDDYLGPPAAPSR